MALTATRRTAPPTRCPNCGGPGGTAATRFLCGPCYADGPTRSCFDPRGRRVAEQPVDRVEPNEYAPPPLIPSDAFDDGPGAPRPRRHHSRRRSLAAELDRAARNDRDDEELLAAIDRLAAEGRYPEVETGRGAAGYFAAVRASGLTDCHGRHAVERLLAAGKVERVTVRVLRHDGREKGQTAAGLRVKV